MTSTVLLRKLYNVQIACPKVEKNTKGQRNKFADLNEIMSKIEAPMMQEKLGIMHYIRPGENNVSLFCTHIYDKESGECVQSSFPISIPTMPSSVQEAGAIMQAAGAVSTYIKRYNISLLLNLQGTDPDLDEVDYGGKTVKKKDLNKLLANSFEKFKEKMKNMCRVNITDEQLNEYFNDKNVIQKLDRLTKFNLNFQVEAAQIIDYFGERLEKF